MNPRMGQELSLALALEGRVQAARAETRKLMALAGSLAALPEPEIDVAFASSLEAKLMGEFEAQFNGRPQLTVVRSIPETPADEVVRRASVVQMPRRRHAVRRSIAAVAAAASLAAFPLAASASSLPGSPFHGVKRGIEQSRLAVFGTPLEDGFFHMELSHRRASELNQLIALGASADRIEMAAGMVDDEMRQGTALVFDNTTDALDLSRLANMAERTEVEMRRAALALGTAEAAVNPAIETSREIQAAVREALGMTIVDTASADGSDNVLGSVSAPASADTSSPGGSSAAPRDADDPKDGGTGGKGSDDDDRLSRNVKDAADDGCEVAGSAQGMGDLLAPLTRATCS